MALFKCEECGKEYSNLADACPNCGAPNPIILESQARAAEAEESKMMAAAMKDSAGSRLVTFVISAVLSFLLAFVVNRDAGIIDNIPVFIAMTPVFGVVVLMIKNLGFITGIIVGLIVLLVLSFVVTALPPVLATILGVILLGIFFVYYLVIPIMAHRKAKELEKQSR